MSKSRHEFWLNIIETDIPDLTVNYDNDSFISAGNHFNKYFLHITLSLKCSDDWIIELRFKMSVCNLRFLSNFSEYKFISYKWNCIITSLKSYLIFHSYWQSFWYLFHRYYFKSKNSRFWSFIIALIYFECL